MVIDTSAILAILLDEPERRAFNEAIEAAESRGRSAATFVEVSMVRVAGEVPSGLVPAGLAVRERLSCHASVIRPSLLTLTSSDPSSASSS